MNDSLKELNEKVIGYGWPSLNTFIDTPGMSPYPIIATGGISSIYAIFKKSLPLMGLTGGFLLSGYSLKHDIQNGSSTAVAWSVIYFSYFARKPVLFRSHALLSIAVLGDLVVYGREMIDFD